MSKVTTDMIRNIALIGHSGEGKTSLAEAMLFNAKSIDRLGKVEDGNTTMDFDAEEINRKISISLAVAYANWKGNKINILDCPGFFDFEGEVVSALSVADSAIIVTSASGSLSVGTEKMLEMCTDRKVPAMVFINQVNKDNADFRGTYNAIEQAFGSKVLPIELPIIEGGKMTGWVDILTGKAYKLSAPEQEIDVPADMKSEVEELKGRLVELAAETDDALIEKYFEGEELTAEELEKGVRQAILNDSLMPLMAGNATTSVGVTNLMDKICKFMPSPVRDVKKTVDGKDVACDANGAFSAQVFKAVADPYVGKLLYFKVYSGVLHSGDQMLNTCSEKPEKASSLYVLKGKKQEAADELVAGDIGALAKLVSTNIGDTLCAPDAKIRFAPIDFPEPVISLAVTSVKSGEEDKVINGLNRMLEEDSTFKLEKNAVTGDVLMSGLGESQLQIICARLKINSASRRNSQTRRSHIAKPSASPPKPKANIRNNRAAQVSSALSTLSSSRARQTAISNSSTLSSAAQFPNSSFPQSKKACAKQSKTAFLQDIRWSTSKQRCSTANTIPSTVRKSRSSPLRNFPTTKPA